MPTKCVTSEVMDAGGKHWTRAEKKARAAASQLVKRKNKRGLYPPSWLSKEALAVWKRVTRSLEGIELLDNIDTELLAVYCDTYAKYKKLTVQQVMTEDDVKALQSYARLIKSYADSLGLSPAARARLVKKKAEEPTDPFGKAFD